MSISRTLTLPPIPHPSTSISITSFTKDSAPHYGLLLCVHTITNRRNRAGCPCTDASGTFKIALLICLIYLIDSAQIGHLEKLLRNG